MNKEQYFSTGHLKDNLRFRAMQGASAIIVAQVFSFCFGTIGTIILARLLTPDDFGLVTMALTISLLLQNFGFNGFTEAIIQKPEINHKQISTLFWINASISLGLALLFIASGPIISWFYNDQRLNAVALAISTSIFFAGLSTQHLALLNRNMEFYKISLITLVASFISISCAILLAAYFRWGYWALVMRWIILPLTTTVCAWLLCRWIPGLPSKGTGVRPMIKFAVNTYGNFITSYFRRNADKILLGKFFGTHSLGIYDRAYHLANVLPNQLVAPIASVAIATLSRVSDDPERYRRSYLEVISLIAFIGFPISAIVTLTGTDLVILLLGSQWYKAGQLLSIFGVALGVMLIYFTHGWLHLSLGTPDRWFRWGIIALIVTIICFIIGLNYGLTGLAVGYSTSYYILAGPGLWYAGKKISLRLSSIVFVVWKYYVSALFAGLLSWFILYSPDLIWSSFIVLNIPFRIMIASTLCISFYLLLVIAMHGGYKPISNFILIFREMIPKISSNR